MRIGVPAATCAALLGAELCAFAYAASELGSAESVTPGLVARYEARFGHGASARLAGWREFARHVEGADPAKLAPVNRFFNRVPALTDQEHWQAAEYWATPAETLASNGGDCEDYAIAKYFTLKELGVPVTRLRLVYVRAERAGPHMVLAYFPTPDADPLILDNLEGAIEKASARTDLTPVYFFNDEDLELLQAHAPSVHLNPASNRQWGVLLQKLQRELAY